VCCVSAISAQSLGEIAAKTAVRDEKPAHNQSTKTYTNAELDGVPRVKPTTTLADQRIGLAVVGNSGPECQQVGATGHAVSGSAG